MNIIEVFSKNVRKYRQKANLSQEKLAENCGLHRTYICQLENKRRSISLNNIQAIADALHIDAYKLFMDNENDN